VIVVDLCCSSISGNGSFESLFVALAVFGVIVVVFALLRTAFGAKPSLNTTKKTVTDRLFGRMPPPIALNTTLIDGQEVAVIDHARVSHVVETLRAPGAVKAVLDTNSPMWAELNAALSGSGAIDADSPFRVIIQVRSALQAGQLDSVRPLLSEQLYQRWKAAPPPPATTPAQRLIMVTNKQSGDDPNRVTVGVSGSLAVPGATAEDWTMVRAAQVATTPPLTEPSTPPTAAPSTCPYCSAPLDPGSTRCHMCGMDVTLAPPTLSPEPALAPTGWIVEDVSATKPMAA
jgi:hypothetical protein